MDLWSLNPAALQGEFWRLWTGHMVHYGAGHFIINLLAAGLPLSLLSAPMQKWILIRAFWIAPVLSLILLSIGGFDELRGLSGLAVFLWCGAGLLLARDGRLAEGSLLLSAVIVKLTLERHVSVSLANGGFEVSTAAHAAAALLAILAIASSRHEKQPTVVGLS